MGAYSSIESRNSRRLRSFRVGGGTRAMEAVPAWGAGGGSSCGGCEGAAGGAEWIPFMSMSSSSFVGSVLTVTCGGWVVVVAVEVAGSEAAGSDLMMTWWSEEEAMLSEWEMCVGGCTARCRFQLERLLCCTR